MKKLLYSSLFIAITFAPMARGGSGLRDEIVGSFAVKPGSTLNFDSDLASVEITTSETDTLRAEFTREFKVSTAQEAEALRQKLDVQMSKTDNDVKITVRWTGDRHDTERQKVRLNFRIAMPRKFNLDLRTIGSARVNDLDGTVPGVVGGWLGGLRPVVLWPAHGVVAAGGGRGEVEDVALGDAEMLEKLPGGVGELQWHDAAEVGGKILYDFVEGGVGLATVEEIDHVLA